jgi:GAF domain-containing protein
MTTERDLDRVLGQVSDGFLAVDDAWRITYADDAARAVLAAAGAVDARDDVDGRTLWSVVPDAVGTSFESEYRRAMESREPVRFEEYYDPLDAWFSVRAYPSGDGLSIYFSDATPRLGGAESADARERILREMYEILADRDRSFESKVEALIDLGRDALGTAYGTLSRIDGDEYVFQVVGADDGEFESGDVIPLSATNCEVTASRERTLVLGDIPRDAPDQTDRAGYTEFGISCYVGAPVVVDDEVYGTFCFYGTEPRAGQFTDWEVTLVDLMTRWVSYELDRQRTTDRLRRQNEMLERFASVVSHDLRSPLEVVRGSLELAAETGEEDHFDRARNGIERMDALIEDLLTMARAGDDVEDPTPTDLAALIRAAWETVETREASLVVDVDRTIMADERRLRQLVENLLRNSVEHGGDAVTVTVGGLPDGFFVADDGEGLPGGDHGRLFESGVSTAPDGTGFGLAIVADVAEAHGWSVSVGESDAGGARFEITGVADAA